LLAGGGLFETGAGGSAPKHVQQFLTEGHLRWDSLGEFLALAVALEDVGQKTNNPAALILAATLDRANSKYLDNGKSPSSKVQELDNRGTHFYLAMYWAQALAEQDENLELKAKFGNFAQQLSEHETAILAELNGAQGGSIDLGGYYHPDMEKVIQAMRSSAVFNNVIVQLAEGI
jgi:isocitrate dehydrogenase